MEIAGKMVFNSKRNVTIHISKADVTKGDVKDPAACAAALACKRELHATDARIHVGRSYLLIGGKWERFQTSPALRSEIITFDRGGAFEPGEYTLKRIHPKTATPRPTKPTGTKDRRVKIAKRQYHQVTGVREKGANR